MQNATEPEAERSGHSIVVIGASAGGVETLIRVVRGLPTDLAATVCIVLHLAPGSPSALPSILQRASSLPCRPAEDGAPLRPGEILVAPPDRHLTVEDGQVSLTVGPRENGHRPAIDALFRTAAVAQDGRVIGVILSGTRDDGTAGLAMIKSCGGTAVVQDPEEAMYPGMPASAIAHVAVDIVVRSDLIAETIVRLVNGDLRPLGSASAAGSIAGAAGPSGATAPDAADDPVPNRGIEEGDGSEVAANPVGDPTGDGDPETAEAWSAPLRGNPGPVTSAPFRGNPGPVTSTCPECGGVLSEYQEAGFTQWRCRVGHRYSPESLADAQAEGVEAAMWAAVRALDDREALLHRIAGQFETRGHARSAAAFRRRAREAEAQAQSVRAALDDAAGTTLQKLSGSDAVEADRRETV